jgi:6,7-dimethyl-8-ribityllumazine synthase
MPGFAEACLAELRRLGVEDEDILHVTVPGALEVPLALKKWQKPISSMH